MRIAICAAAVALLSLLVGGPAWAQTPAENATAQELATMLRQFLDNVPRGDSAVFDRFFADDVIYTRATGLVRTKADIMKDIGSLKPTENSKTTYSAEDVTVHVYGDAAVVAFRLVGRTEHPDGKVETAKFRNTGTFLRRNNRWQVVAWQATKIADAAE